ncbi:MAG: hypothetical protein GVY30_12785 [Chloroflexi bacterium]|nr:hypothetical protein [Chloroflexota bacterium]
MAQQILARAIIAAGYGLMEKRFLPTVQVTIEAAEAYVLAPTDEHFERYVIAATNSYPFGSGEGCYAIAELGYEGCALGSGCGSGAGSLGSFAAELGDAVVMELIAAELIPWLREEGDPVASRVLPRRSVGRGAVA